MKVICDKAALVEALGVVSSVIVSRTPKEVLLCVKLSAKDDMLTLSGTDLEVSVVMTVTQVEVAEPGDLLVPADKLSAIVREWNEPTITIESDGEAAHLKGADSDFRIFGHVVDDYPALTNTDVSPQFEVSSPVLADLVHRTQFATARENSRYAINGVLFEREDKKLTLVSTDGKRLALATGLVSPSGEDEPLSVIVPTKALTLIPKLFNDPDEAVYFAMSEGKAIFKSQDAALSTNLVEGNFPPYKDVVPKDHDRKATFDVSTLASGVRRAAVLTNEESKCVRMAFSEDGLELSSRTPEMGEAKVNVSMASFSGDAIEIGFNPFFVIDALKIVDTEQITFEFKAPNKPGLMKSGKDFVYVIMPLGLG